MKKKLSKNGGFTLVEMLIVVAIIAILIAVSIPLINSSLEKARDAADQANERAAKAEAAILILDQDGDYAEMVGVADAAKYSDLTGAGAFYDAKNGVLMAKRGTFEGYGRCKNTSSCYCYDSTASTHPAHTDQVVKVVYSDTDGYKISWED